MRSYQLTFIIQQTIEPESWFIYGGQGEIHPFSGTRLIVRQTPSVHRRIKNLIDKLRTLIGDQVAIETRFLLVDENFLEDIGLDTDISFNPGSRWTGGGAGGLIEVSQSSYSAVVPGTTKITSSLAEAAISHPAISSSFTYDGGGLLDDLTVSFVLRATQMHANSKILTAPKAMVLNGESASLSINQQRNYVSEVEFNSEAVQTGIATPIITVGYWDITISQITTGVTLSITPTITADKKYVLLMIMAFLNDQLSGGEDEGMVQGLLGDQVVSNFFDLPELQNTMLMTRVKVPDQGTVLLGGLTLSAEREVQSGVPVLSKIPILGRLFSNRSEIKDKQILLILVKPTIILKEESEARAIAAME